MIVDKNKDIARLQAQVYCFINLVYPQINSINTSFISFSCFLVVQTATNFACDVTMFIGRISNKLNWVGRMLVTLIENLSYKTILLMGTCSFIYELPT